MIAFSFTRRQRQGRENRAKKQPRAIFARYKIGVFALPAQAGACGKRFFHDWRSIDEDLELAAGFLDELACNAFQAFFDDVVIIAVLRVNGNHAPAFVLKSRHRIAVGAIIHAEHDDGFCIPPERARMRSFIGTRGQPSHVAMAAKFDKTFQIFTRGVWKGCRRKANGIESAIRRNFLNTDGEVIFFAH